MPIAIAIHEKVWNILLVCVLFYIVIVTREINGRTHYSRVRSIIRTTAAQLVHVSLEKTLRIAFMRVDEVHILESIQVFTYVCM